MPKQTWKEAARPGDSPQATLHVTPYVAPHDTDRRIGYLPVLGATDISIRAEDRKFDRAKLISLRDIILPGQGEQDQSDPEEDSDTGETVEALAARESQGELPISDPVADEAQQQSLAEAALQEQQTLSSTYYPTGSQLPDPGSFMHYFEAPVDTGAPIIDVPFFLPHQNAPLIIGGDARYRIVPSNADAGSSHD